MNAAELLLRCGVERAGRLVEQPDRAFHGEKAGDRKAAPLAGGKIGGGQVDERVQPDRRQRLRNLGGAAPKKRDQKRRFSPTESDGFSASWWPR